MKTEATLVTHCFAWILTCVHILSQIVDRNPKGGTQLPLSMLRLCSKCAKHTIVSLANHPVTPHWEYLFALHWRMGWLRSGHLQKQLLINQLQVFLRQARKVLDRQLRKVEMLQVEINFK